MHRDFKRYSNQILKLFQRDVQHYSWSFNTASTFCQSLAAPISLSTSRIFPWPTLILHFSAKTSSKLYFETFHLQLPIRTVSSSTILKELCKHFATINEFVRWRYWSADTTGYAHAPKVFGEKIKHWFNDVLRRHFKVKMHCMHHVGKTRQRNNSNFFRQRRRRLAADFWVWILEVQNHVFVCS